MGVAAWRNRRAQCRGTVGDRELALRGGQDDHGTGHQQLFGCRVHDRLECGLVYRIERRRAFRGFSARFFLLGEGRDDKADGQPNGK
jgi:hypothetical protein